MAARQDPVSTETATKAGVVFCWCFSINKTEMQTVQYKVCVSGSGHVFAASTRLIMAQPEASSHKCPDTTWI